MLPLLEMLPLYDRILSLKIFSNERLKLSPIYILIFIAIILISNLIIFYILKKDKDELKSNIENLEKELKDKNINKSISHRNTKKTEIDNRQISVTDILNESNVKEIYFLRNLYSKEIGMLEIDKSNNLLFNQTHINSNSNLKELIKNKNVGEVFYIPNLGIGNSIEANTYELIGIKSIGFKENDKGNNTNKNVNINDVRNENNQTKSVKKEIKEEIIPEVNTKKKLKLETDNSQKCIDIDSKFKVRNIKSNEIEEYQFVNNKLKENLIENIVFTGSLMFKSAKGKKVGDIFEIQTVKPSGASNVEKYKILEIF